MSKADRAMPGPAIDRLRFAGLPIHPLSVEQAATRLGERAADAPFAPYVTPNVEFIFYARRLPEVREALERAVLSTNDSRILHRLGKLAGLELNFAPGAYVVDRLFRSVIAPDDPLALIGGDPALAEALRRRFGLRRLVHHSPPMGFIADAAAVRAAVAFIGAHPSRFVFIAMGPPQSEQFCLEVMRSGGASGVGLCIGSAIQVLCGALGAAPDWMEQSGLVWLHRLVREPQRLWRRYLLHDLYGVAVCARDILERRLGQRGPIA